MDRERGGGGGPACSRRQGREEGAAGPITDPARRSQNTRTECGKRLTVPRPGARLYGTKWDLLRERSQKDERAAAAIATVETRDGAWGLCEEGSLQGGKRTISKPRSAP